MPWLSPFKVNVGTRCIQIRRKLEEQYTSRQTHKKSSAHGEILKIEFISPCFTQHECKPTENGHVTRQKLSMKHAPTCLHNISPLHVPTTFSHAMSQNMSPRHVPTTCALVCADLKASSGTSRWRTIHHSWRFPRQFVTFKTRVILCNIL